MAAANVILNSIKASLCDYTDLENILEKQHIFVTKFIAGLVELFGFVDDKRVLGRCTYVASEVLTASFIGILAGKNTWTELDTYLHNKREWCFRHFPSMKAANTIPTHDTLERIFSRMDMEQLQCVCLTYFEEHAANLCKRLDCEIPENVTVAIDGKVERGTGRSYNDKEGGEVKDMQTLHIYNTATGMCMGAIPINEKTNEIPVAQDFLSELASAQGMVFTGDAMHCQKNTTRIIYEKGGDFCFGTKGNQKLLLGDAMDLFSPEVIKELVDRGDSYFTYDKAHGCIETRLYFTAKVSDYPGLDLTAWTNVNSITMCQKTIESLQGGETTTETRFYISSLTDVKSVAGVIRGHWTVESVLHEVLDKVFKCDMNTTMNWTATTNLFMMYKMAMPMLDVLSPLVYKGGFNNVRACVNDAFEDSMRKLTWLFSPTIKKKIFAKIRENLARLAEIRKQRNEKREQCQNQIA